MALRCARALLWARLPVRALPPVQSRTRDRASEVPARAGGAGVGPGACAGGGEVREEASKRAGGEAGPGAGLRARERVHWGLRGGEPAAVGGSARLRSRPLRKAAPLSCAVGSSRRERLFIFFFPGLRAPVLIALLLFFPASRHALLGRRGRRLGQQAGSGRGWLFFALRAPLRARNGSHPRVRARCGLRPVQVRATARWQDCKPRPSVQPWLRRGLAETFKSFT